MGGQKFKNIQPQYGGKRIDERALYNPHLEEAFNYMDKPLFSPNPYSSLRLIEPITYNPQNIGRNDYVTLLVPPPEYLLPVQEISPQHTSQKQKETISV